MSSDHAVETLFRRESGRLVAYLARTTHDFDLAEDVVQETLVRALKNWSITGVPENPAAWMTATAKRLVVDAMRRDQVLARILPKLAGREDQEEDVRDRLSLMFACCDPVLPGESQIALTLHTMGGMTSTEIAGCLCSQPNAVEQRVSRAKRRLRESGLPMALPEPERMGERLGSVLSVLYQIFGAGYSAHAGSEAVRIDLCSDALYLVRLLRSEKSTDLPSTRALYAVFLFLAARLPARTDDWGNVLRLEQQDRSLWDKGLVTAAFDAFGASMSGTAMAALHVEAAILAEHARAPDFQTTDWHRIFDLYSELQALQDTPLVRLNRAIAQGLAQGSNVGLASLSRLDSEPSLQTNPSLPAAKARFLSELGRQEEACNAYREAASKATNGAERAYLEGMSKVGLAPGS